MTVIQRGAETDMSFELCPYGPLKGIVKLPGDTVYSLSILVLGMTVKAEIEITGLSESPDVSSFIGFLEKNGAITDKIGNTHKFTGTGWGKSVIIDETVPANILHQVLASSIFVSDELTIIGDKDFIGLAGVVLDKLSVFGLKNSDVKRTDTSITVENANFCLPEDIIALSSWEFEIYSAAAFSRKAEINISAGAAPVDYILKQMDFFGYRAGTLESENTREKELARRMKRFMGEKDRPAKKFRWHGKTGWNITIPGDTVLASAICAAVSIIEKSDVEIKNVLWDNGRRGFFESLKKMKTEISWQPLSEVKPSESADIKVKWSKKEGANISLAKTGMLPAEAFIIAVVASLSSGETVINGLAELMYRKDIIKDFTRNMEKIGARIGYFPDGLIMDGVLNLTGGLTADAPDKETLLALVVAGIVSSENSYINIPDNDYYLKTFLKIIGNLSGTNARIKWVE